MFHFTPDTLDKSILSVYNYRKKVRCEIMFHQIKNSKTHHFSGIIYEHQSWDCHFHNSFELIYVISGELTATVNNINISVNTDDFLLISPCMAHSLESSAGTKFFIAIFTPDFVSEFNNTGSFYKFSVKGTTLEYLKENLIFSLKPSRLTLRSLLYAICSEAETAGADDTPSNRSSFVIAVNAYISENFSHDFRRKDVSEALGYEEHYFSDLFHKSFGVGLKKYLNIYRFSKARKLLETTDQSITSVAFASGFPSVRSFNIIFKELSGKTPSEYRKVHVN